MSLKGWLLGKVHGPGTRERWADAPRGDAAAGLEAASRAHDAAEGGRTAHAHLGPYAPLIAAIREELEQFAESPLRLHLAIAERDRYVLASIDVACDDGDGPATFSPANCDRSMALALRNPAMMSRARNRLICSGVNSAVKRRSSVAGPSPSSHATSIDAST
jgi:hypothetical protein